MNANGYDMHKKLLNIIKSMSRKRALRVLKSYGYTVSAAVLACNEAGLGLIWLEAKQ